MWNGGCVLGRLAALLALTLTGCSALLERDCVTQEVGPLTLAACDDARDQLEGVELIRWVDGSTRLICAWEQVLAEESMPPLLEHLEGVSVDLIADYDAEGIYAGLYRYDTGGIELYLREPGAVWWRSAMSHELMHLYDDRVLAFSSTDWVSMEADPDDPRHFALGDFGQHLQRLAKLTALQYEPAPVCF